MSNNPIDPIETPGIRGDGAKPSDASAESANTNSGERLKETWNDSAQAVRSSVENRVRTAIDQGQQAAASEVEDFAGALHGAAGSVDPDSPSAHIAGGAAEALDRISQTLRSKELGTMVRDLESMARRQPALFLGAAVAAGFVAVRFLKAAGGSHEPSSSTQHDRMGLALH